MKTTFFKMLFLATCVTICFGCATLGSALPVVCSTIDQICKYEGLLCNLSANKAKMSKAKADSLEIFYRAQLVALADSLKNQSQPVK